MSALGHIWRFWTESWRAPGRARRLYAALAVLAPKLATLTKRDVGTEP